MTLKESTSTSGTTADLARVASLQQALQAGRVCLHPTDTLPGLTFDPSHADAIRVMRQIKQRDASKSFLSLVPDLLAAQRYWQPLPAIWLSALERLWPGPLSVIWEAAQDAPQILQSQRADVGGSQAEIGLRVPSLANSEHWLYAVMQSLTHPLPTTSVNHSGEPARETWAGCLEFLRVYPEVYIPDGDAKLPPSPVKPSTLIRLARDGSYEVLRAGALPIAKIDEVLQQI